MKFSRCLLLLAALSGSTVADNTTDTDGCPDTHEPRCYCASSTSSNQNCDPTQRITQISTTTGDECATYCVDECGEGAGSSFACHIKDEPLAPCNEDVTYCTCAGISCENDAVVPPSPIQFGEQCGAFCRQEDVCGSDAGALYICPSPGPSEAALNGSTVADNTTDTDGCPDSHEPRCYCASSTSSNQNCDPTQRITQISTTTGDECATYCVDECGEGAGSSFACHIKDEPLAPCNEDATTCTCTGTACENGHVPPSPIQFGGQCTAFCRQEDVCGSDAGSSYSCPGPGSSAFKVEQAGVVAGSLFSVAVMAWMAM